MSTRVCLRPSRRLGKTVLRHQCFPTPVPKFEERPLLHSFVEYLWIEILLSGRSILHNRTNVNTSSSPNPAHPFLVRNGLGIDSDISFGARVTKWGCSDHSIIVRAIVWLGVASIKYTHSFAGICCSLICTRTSPSSKPACCPLDLGVTCWKIPDCFQLKGYQSSWHDE